MIANWLSLLQAWKIPVFFYGDKDELKKQAKKDKAGKKLREELSTAALARRSTFNASASGEVNLLGSSELVDAISRGRVELDDIAEEEMPASLRAMAPAEQKVHIAKQAERRDNIKQEIKKLSQSRQRFIEEQMTSEDAEKSLDEKIYSAVKEQAKTKGLIYKNESAEY